MHCVDVPNEVDEHLAAKLDEQLADRRSRHLIWSLSGCIYDPLRDQLGGQLDMRLGSKLREDLYAIR